MIDIISGSHLFGTDIYQSIKSIDEFVDDERFGTIRILGCTFDNDKPDRKRLENLCACQQADHCAERERKLFFCRG